MQSEKKSRSSGVWIECWIKNPEWNKSKEKCNPTKMQGG